MATVPLQPFTQEIIARLKNGEATALIAGDIAAKAGVSQELALQYTMSVFRENRERIVAG